MIHVDEDVLPQQECSEAKKLSALVFSPFWSDFSPAPLVSAWVCFNMAGSIDPRIDLKFVWTKPDVGGPSPGKR